MSATFVVRDDLEALSHEVAERVAAAAREAVGKRGRCAIALAGGETPGPLYRILIWQTPADEFPWAKVSWWWSDERCVPPDHPESNYRMAYASLLAPAGVAEETIHRIAGERPPAEAARDYEALLRQELPDGALDIVLLGAGADGHTASLFPGSPVLEERERWVVDAEAPPSQVTRDRITLTYPMLNRGRDVFVLAAGAGKRAVVTAVREDAAAAARRYPVARLAPAGRLSWCVDRAAAG